MPDKPIKRTTRAGASRAGASKPNPALDHDLDLIRQPLQDSWWQEFMQEFTDITSYSGVFDPKVTETVPDAELLATLEDYFRQETQQQQGLGLEPDPSVLTGRPAEVEWTGGLSGVDFAPTASGDFGPRAADHTSPDDFLSDATLGEALADLAHNLPQSPSITHRDGWVLYITPHENMHVVGVKVNDRYFFLGKYALENINEAVTNFKSFINDFTNFIVREDPATFVQNYSQHSVRFLQDYPHHKKCFEIYNRNMQHQDKAQQSLARQLEVIEQSTASSASSHPPTKRPRRGG
jgi:hypothetical protein